MSFRTDLRLRPTRVVTLVCISISGALAYYEAEGRTWERSAYIKARPCAGDLAAGESVSCATCAPSSGAGTLISPPSRTPHDMRLRIRDHKGPAWPHYRRGHNMKLGRGGIREIEFFTQTRQLIAGGRDPDLRVRGTVEGLARLAEKGWVPPMARELTDHYREHREIEHRIQMVNDAQTHSLPNSAEGVDTIARDDGRCRYRALVRAGWPPAWRGSSR